ncbi:MAG: hypothetical protein JO107_12995, partial [Hyphomicrobiales bacterium]|nr:hypothetical protein [Hyphomicrobiales bacterium]MBV8664006.1 hypothetical protein [Hyphomicrobiales bacterium]
MTMRSLSTSCCAAALAAALALAAPAAFADPSPAPASLPQGAQAAPAITTPTPEKADAPSPSPTTPPAPPLAAAMQSALDAMPIQDFKTSPIGAGDWRAAMEAIRAFYAARANAPLWVDDKGLTPAGASALARLRRADEDGLDLSAFALPKEPLVATQEALAQADVVLSEAVVA